MPFKFTFRGVRGSYAVPGPSTLRVGGNTTCLEVRVEGNLILFDAGTGIIQVGREVAEELAERRKTQPDARVVASIFFSHMHHDHTQGFPFFKPVYFETSELHLFGPRMMNTDFGSGLATALLSPLFPVELSDMRAAKHIHNIYDTDVVVYPLSGEAPVMVKNKNGAEEYGPETPRVRCCHSYAHPNGGSMVYRIEWNGKSVVFATDVEGYVGGDQRLIHFAKGADALIHDAQYEEKRYFGYPNPVQGFGHSTPEMAAHVARSAGVRRLFLHHHDPESDDELVEAMAERARKSFPNTQPAVEGLTIEL
ncbi:MBL fold metallo-hydrolase [bacterium]|nr:MBL fold metallo-hydrolase [bacterium]